MLFAAKTEEYSPVEDTGCGLTAWGEEVAMGWGGGCLELELGEEVLDDTACWFSSTILLFGIWTLTGSDS